MTADYRDGQQNSSRSDETTGGEVKIQIAERNGQKVIIIKEQEAAETDLTSQQIIEIPAQLLPDLKRAVAAIEENAGDKPASPALASFAHESEAEFARILDFYHIAWQYEPQTFPVEWDEQGQVTRSFTPDFYLPQHNLYIELTTLKQSLVTKKNRKVRRLRELYPEINIKILYASDYRKLVEKFAGSAAWQDEQIGRESNE